MILKNATMYKLDGEFPSPSDLAESLAKMPLLPLSAVSTSSRGFVPVNSGNLVEWMQEFRLFTFATQERRIPGETMRAELQKAAEALEKQQGFKPGRKQLRDLKDKLFAELLPRAFTRTKRFNVLFDAKTNIFAVDTANASHADAAMCALRDVLGELPATPLLEQPKVSTFLSNCLRTQVAPTGALELVPEMEVYTDGEARVKYDGTGIPEACNRVNEGMRVRKLAFRHNGTVTFSLDEKGVLSKLRLGESVESDDKDDAELAFEAEFIAAGLILSSLTKTLTSVIH